MRSDVLDTFEDFERIAEDYFMLIPPDTDSFDLELCTKWIYDDLYNTLTFYFDDEWNLDTFLDKITECPKYQETYDIGDHFDGVDRKNLKIIVEGKATGL